jgi:hypothetical protein
MSNKVFTAKVRSFFEHALYASCEKKTRSEILNPSLTLLYHTRTQIPMSAYRHKNKRQTLLYKHTDPKPNVFLHKQNPRPTF